MEVCLERCSVSCMVRLQHIKPSLQACKAGMRASTRPTQCMSLYDLWWQATSYLCTAWEALAAREDVPMAKLPVVFEDVSIKQAVQAEAGDNVTLRVLLDHSSRFQVCMPALAPCYCWCSTDLPFPLLAIDTP